MERPSDVIFKVCLDLRTTQLSNYSDDDELQGITVGCIYKIVHS